MAFASIKRVSGPLHLVERACLYVTIVFVVYLVQVRPGALAGYEVYQNTYFVLLVIAVAISFRFAGPNRFKVSTLDFLIIFLAVTVPNIAGGDSHLGKAIAEVIVLFYGVEVVLSSMWRRWILLRLSTMTILLMLGLRGI